MPDLQLTDTRSTSIICTSNEGLTSALNKIQCKKSVIYNQDRLQWTRMKIWRPCALLLSHYYYNLKFIITIYNIAYTLWKLNCYTIIYNVYNIHYYNIDISTFLAVKLWVNSFRFKNNALVLLYYVIILHCLYFTE